MSHCAGKSHESLQFQDGLKGLDSSPGPSLEKGTGVPFWD